MSGGDELAAVAALLVVGGLLLVAYLIWPTSRRVEEAQIAARERRAAAAVLAAGPVVAADVPAGPNYWPTDEYLPLHTASAADVTEPVEVEPEPAEPPTAPWWTHPVALADEPTPIWCAGRPYPVLDLDLSATNSWNRAALRQRLGMDAEEAA